MGFRALCVILLLAVASAPVSADFLSTITNGLNTATNAVDSGLNTATNAIAKGVGTAVNATGQGLNIAANATESGINTAVNKSGGFINTAVDSVKDAYNVSFGTVKNFTSTVQTALAPAADTIGHTVDSLGSSIYNVTTGTYKGAVSYASGATSTSSASSASNTTTTQNTTVDATNATSILNAITTNSSGFISVANSLLVALGRQQTSGVEGGIKNVINNSTGNTTYPASGPSNTTSLGLAEAIVTAIITANNYSVTVDYQGKTNSVNVSQVVEVWMAGLQDALTPCAKNVSSTTNATSGSSDYFQAIASGCCYLVAQPLTYAEALSQSNGVGSEYDEGLAASQLLGQSPSLDLTRCLTNQAPTS